MLDEMGVVRASELISLRSNTEVLIAGVRIATQSPPMRSGKRVVFISLDDGSGCADATFFDESQRRASQVLVQNKLLLIARIQVDVLKFQKNLNLEMVSSEQTGIAYKQLLVY